MPQYPTNRPPFFSQRYIRLLSKTCAAQEIGTNAALLCTVVAAQEDAKRYSGPVTFYNNQLLPIIGASKWETLDRARQSAVKGQWLHYEAPPSGERRAGLYWVTIPDEFNGTTDGACDEPSSSQSVSAKRIRKTDTVPEKRIRKTDIEGGKLGGNSLYLSPNPSKQASAGEISDDQLSENQRTFAINLHKDFIAILKVKRTDKTWWDKAKQVACDESAQQVTVDLLDEITESKGSIKKPDRYFNSKFDDNLETAKALSKGGA